MARGGIRVDTSIVRKNLQVYGQSTVGKAKMGMQILVANNENRAKQNRPWTDRTGQARSSITGSYEFSDTSLIGALAIGAYHGIFLEKANGGKYAIVWPTILETQRELLEVARIAMTSRI